MISSLPPRGSVPYKRVDLIVQAFTRMPQRQLVVIGDGPDRAKIAALANGHPNIKLLGYQSHEVLRDHMRRAKAFVFAAEEDFGIAPVEAQACGTPVIAFGRGGVLDIVRGMDHLQPTGVFFAEQTVDAIIGAIDHFDIVKGGILAADCRSNAERFSVAQFRKSFSDLVDKEWLKFAKRGAI